MFYLRLIFEMVCLLVFVGRPMSFRAKAMASLIGATSWIAKRLWVRHFQFYRF